GDSDRGRRPRRRPHGRPGVRAGRLPPAPPRRRPRGPPGGRRAMTDVVVVGSFMTDLVVSAPRRPVTRETIVGTGFAEHCGGTGCNRAVAASRAGAATALVGRVGADAHGRRFLDLLAREGIDATHVTVDDVEGTGVATPLVEPSGANSIVIVPRA